MSAAVSDSPPRPASVPWPLLVYRDRIGVPSELQFLRRQYAGFTRLSPVWVGRHIMPQAAELGGRVLRVGGDGPTGWLRRLAFRHLGYGAALPTERFAPVLHAQFARGGALALPLMESLGLRLVVTLHGGDVSKARNWHGTVQARRWPAVLRAASRFVCVSAAVAEAARAHGARPGQVTVLPIGADIPAALPALPAGPPVHLFVGRFVEKKGIAVLAGAIRRLRAAGDATPVLCIGDGPERPLLDALARDVPGVTLPGWQPPAAVAVQMAQAWSLLVPSVVAAGGDAEGLPSVIPEAMAQGCPVIGSAHGGIAEAVRHGETGLLVPPGDPTALAEAMHRLVSEPMLRHQLGEASYRFVQVHLNARLQSAALEALLLEVGT